MNKRDGAREFPTYRGMNNVCRENGGLSLAGKLKPIVVVVLGGLSVCWLMVCGRVVVEQQPNTRQAKVKYPS